MTQAVLQITGLLGMYQAELARVLYLNCADIGEMANARAVIQPGTLAWQQAEQFIRFFERLYQRYAGDEVKMCHWLRAQQAGLNTSPLLLMVDEHRLADVIRLLEQSQQQSDASN